MSPGEFGGGPSPKDMEFTFPDKEVLPPEDETGMEAETKKLPRLSREEVEVRLEARQNLEGFDLSGLDLAGLSLEGVSFRGSDVHGVQLFREAEGESDRVLTKISRADFSEAIIACQEGLTDFGGVKAEGATFGYAESVANRRARYPDTGGVAKIEDSGGLFGFCGDGGRFKGARWVNVDFGGPDYGTSFISADLSESSLEGCDLSGIDFSKTKIEGIKIINPESLAGMTINENQIETVVRAISFTDDRQDGWLEALDDEVPRMLLEEKFQIKIVSVQE
ncbi:MAG: pentapeptide repeat-containing protein [Candidatus Uhrbacteria bacterium]